MFIWRRKLSFLLFASIFILITLWTWAIFNATQTKEFPIIDKIVNWEKNIHGSKIRIQSVVRANEMVNMLLNSSQKPKKTIPVVETYSFEEERLKILQNQQQKNLEPLDETLDYDKILSSGEREKQYQYSLSKMDVPIVSGIGPEGSRPPHQRLVHLDLKGAPPKLSFLEKLLPTLKTLGATGLLIEYEDMFPYTGNIQNISAVNAYSAKELKDFLKSAVRIGLNIIPLVQTFGHMEFVLKLEEFEDLREVQNNPQTICPNKKESMKLLHEMITQIVEFHLELNSEQSNGKSQKFTNMSHSEIIRSFTNIHIGCNEVEKLGACNICSLHNQNELFLLHVTALGSFIQNKWPQLKPIIWDDMFHGITESQMLSSRIGYYVEPMIWVHEIDIYEKVNQKLWTTYWKIFPAAWVASAFKGTNGLHSTIPPIKKHLHNNLNWLAVIEKEGSMFLKGLRGIVLTGRQRFNHFGVLCELFAASMPSLITSLSTVSKGYFSVDLNDNDIMKVLNCPVPLASRHSTSAWINFETKTHHKQLFSICSYPASAIYVTLLKLERTKKEVESFLDDDDNYMRISEYNIRHNFSSLGAGTKDLTDHTQNWISELQMLSEEIYSTMTEVYDIYTITEFIETYIFPLIQKLNLLLENVKNIRKHEKWP